MNANIIYSMDMIHRKGDFHPFITIGLYIVIFIISLVGNVLVIVTLMRHKRILSVTNVFLVNLAVGDLVLAIVCMPFTLIGSLLQNFIFGITMCKVIPFLQAMSVSISVWTLVSISQERYFAICRPFFSRQWQTVSHSLKVIALIWVWSIICPMPILMVSKLRSVGHSSNTKRDSGISGDLVSNSTVTRSGRVACREIWDTRATELAYNWFLNLQLLLIPLCIMAFNYAKICRVLWRAGDQESNVGPHKHHKYKFNTKTLLKCGWREKSSHQRSSQQQTTQSMELTTLNDRSSFTASYNRYSPRCSNQSTINNYPVGGSTISHHRPSLQPSCMGCPSPILEAPEEESKIITTPQDVNLVVEKRNKSLVEPMIENVEEIPTINATTTATATSITAAPSKCRNKLARSETWFHCMPSRTRLLPNRIKRRNTQILSHEASVREEAKRRRKMAPVALRRSQAFEATCRQSASRKKVIRMLCAVVIEFFVCWTPLYVVNAWALHDPASLYKSIRPSYVSLIHLLAYVSACCNPITYCFLNPVFRQSLVSSSASHISSQGVNRRFTISKGTLGASTVPPRIGSILTNGVPDLTTKRRSTTIQYKVPQFLAPSYNLGTNPDQDQPIGGPMIQES